MRTEEPITKRELGSLLLLLAVNGNKSKCYHAICLAVGLTLGCAGCGTVRYQSPDGTRTVNLKGSWKVSVVENGQLRGKYDVVQVVQFSPDSKHLAYAVADINLLGRSNWKNSHVIFDGQPQQRYEQIAGSSLAFSSDSQHLAYVASRNGKWLYVVDGVEHSGLFYDTAPPHTFRALGKAFSTPPGGPALLICDAPMYLEDKESRVRQSKEKHSADQDEIKLEPGHHLIKVMYAGLVGGQSGASDRFELEVDVRAGHVYLVCCQTTTEGYRGILSPHIWENLFPFSRTVGEVRAWIEDLTDTLSRSIKY